MGWIGRSASGTESDGTRLRTVSVPDLAEEHCAEAVQRLEARREGRTAGPEGEQLFEEEILGPNDEDAGGDHRPCLPGGDVARENLGIQRRRLVPEHRDGRTFDVLETGEGQRPA